MAPHSHVDIESTNGSTDGVMAEQPYNVPDTVLFHTRNRKLKVITIGTGVSGIMMAYHAQKDLQNVDFVMYEMNHDIGGTWLLNKYPGCACDIPSHAYTYSFALNPDWSQFFSSAQEIWSYLDRVVTTFNLRQYMKFSTEVLEARWSETSSKWIVKLRETGSNGSTRDFTDECDVLLQAAGVLNKFKWPEIEGIEKFKGKMIHTARWPDNYQKEEWAKDRVAVIGSGASSIQTVPSMQPYVRSIDVFVRTPVWFVEVGGNNGRNIEYTSEQKATFRRSPKELVSHAKSLEDKVNLGFDIFRRGSAVQQQALDHYIKRTASKINNPALAAGMTPKWSVGCRRVTPGDPYMSSIQEPNVSVHFAEVTKITETSIIGGNGVSKEVDTIICATGFDTSFRPSFPIVGRDGVDLAKKWATQPEAYLGMAVPDMPNFFTFIGPSWPIGNGSVMGPLEAVGCYVVKFIKKMQNEQIASFIPRQEVTDAFNVHVQEFMKSTVWMDDCRSWYKDPKTNRVNALWPGESLHYIETIEQPRFEDFEFRYQNNNPWAYLGNGTALARAFGGDTSPYMALDRIDEKWLRETEQDVKNRYVGM
ncbi:flavin-binding monooxygenase-like protein [Leptodontidium sp. MPI-SDFR-AT-0119]|nr:flavin-binding monooxygenase-like protein [Leptodontidium sp. MPI-SDFR-AT-0119]